MTSKRAEAPNPPADPGTLRRRTREWLTKTTIPNLRMIASDLENTGEDIEELLEAINELEDLVKAGTERPTARGKGVA